MRFPARKISLFVGLVIALTSCSSSQSTVPTISTASALSITGSETPAAHRVVALANGSAEIISALGWKSAIVGRDIASTDKDLAAIPIVTSGHQVIPEKILSLNPDLVLIDASTGPAQAIATLKSAGIKVVSISEAWKLSDIHQKIVDIASALAIPNSGAALSDAISTHLQSLPTVPTGTRIAFLYLRGGSAIYLLGGKGSGADSLIAAIGAIDAGAELLAQPFTAITSEELIKAKPDLILVMTKGLESVGGVDGLIKLPGIMQTPAGKNRRVIAVDDSLLLSFGPRTPSLLQELSRTVSDVMKK